MDYQKHYTLLIERARIRLLEGYGENHHVIPRCLGGSNKKKNIVKLTAEEHYVAHQLLVKIYPENKFLAKGALMMCTASKEQVRNNKLYGWVRRRFGEAQREFMTGRKHSEETKRKIGNVHRGKIVSKETRKLLSEINLGKKRPNMVHPFQKKIKCIETGKIYKSLAEAGRDVNLTANAIANCISGKQKRNKNFSWELIKEIS